MRFLVFVDVRSCALAGPRLALRGRGREPRLTRGLPGARRARRYGRSRRRADGSPALPEFRRAARARVVGGRGRRRTSSLPRRQRRERRRRAAARGRWGRPTRQPGRLLNPLLSVLQSRSFPPLAHAKFGLTLQRASWEKTRYLNFERRISLARFGCQQKKGTAAPRARRRKPVSTRLRAPGGHFPRLRVLQEDVEARGRCDEQAGERLAGDPLSIEALAELIDQVGGRQVQVARAKVLVVINPQAFLVESASIVSPVLRNLDRVLVLVDAPAGALRGAAAASLTVSPVKKQSFTSWAAPGSSTANWASASSRIPFRSIVLPRR